MASVSSLVSAHTRFAAMALLVLVVWGAGTAVRNNEVRPGSIDIGVQHASPRSAVTIRTATGGDVQLMDIGNAGDDALRISLPASWERTEVRHVPIDAVAAGEEELGFRTWTFPVNAEASFRTGELWQEATIHNPSGIPLTVRFTRVDLLSEEATFDVYLVQRDPLRIR